MSVKEIEFMIEQPPTPTLILFLGKHVNQWLTERGAAVSFLDRHAILQQVLNTMATIHNKNRDTSLWGCFMGMCL